MYGGKTWYRNLGKIGPSCDDTEAFECTSCGKMYYERWESALPEECPCTFAVPLPTPVPAGIPPAPPLRQTQQNAIQAETMRRLAIQLCLGIGGDPNVFRREGDGWRLGDTIVVTPWMAGKAVPDDAAAAMNDIHVHVAQKARTIFAQLGRHFDWPR